MYKFIDLFAGIGGFHYAFSNVGAQCVFASELDLHARKTYLENHQIKEENFAGDINLVKIENIPDFNILCAGFPCQPFSQAGFKKGFFDTRGTLFFKILEIIDKKSPDAFFLENVRHLYKHDDGNTFETIRNSLLDKGYSFQHFLVKASDYGLPQHRPRLFMIGFKNGAKINQPQKLPLKFTMSDVLNGKCEKKIGYTLRVGGRGSAITDRRNWDSYKVDDNIVRIGAKEGLLMQGFPDDFTFPVSATQAMKQLGNSVAIPAIQAFAGEIVKALDNRKVDNVKTA
ncbi:MAG: DNA cytosine methyltransferase [Devosiaceae bacterium]|nr:DNA cytosine methyltransferase [Devosiaceae bacterium]